ncbi:protein of unknown function DUF23 domain-containing protein [Aphelenchoides fujianensis]|nr:protein of unknown function DUF23 domain-containing protein [Aphelenchoides fujianensis]
MEELKKLTGTAANARRSACAKCSPRSLALLLCNYVLVIGTILFLLTVYFVVTRTRPNNEPTGRTFQELTYIRSAYRVSDSTIRLVIVRSVENRRNLTYEFGLKRGNIRLECHNEKCPDEFSPPCVITGFVGIIDGLTKNNRDSYMAVFSEGNETPLFVDITDARRKNAPPHELGVMVQPVYLHTDFSAFVQFFEFWLSENCTKFYIYRESYTREVGELLDFYSKQKGVDVEFIDWTGLPEGLKGEEATDELNPNRYWFRLEDLDEMLYVGPKRSVIDFMRAMDVQEPEMAAVSFRSQRVQISNGSWINVKHPKELSFSNLESVVLENKVFKRPLYSKMVYKPERVYRAHIHRQLPTEPILGTDRSYKHVNIAPEGGVVLHVRRLPDMYKWTNATNSDIVKAKAQTMQKNAAQRFKNFKSSLTEWNNYGLKVNEKIEKCRQAMNKNRRNACHNLFDCDRLITNVRWIRPPNSWMVV